MQKNKLVFQPAKCLSEEEIRLYLSGKADELSRFRIENHLLDCPLCAEALEGFAGGYAFDQDEQLGELKKAVMGKSVSTGKISKMSFWTLNRIAAAILFLILSAATLVYWNAKNSEKNYLSQFQSSEDVLENLRSSDDFPAGSEFEEGLEFFRNENYRESLLFFDNLLESQPENAVAYYFSGLSALNVGELNKAIENLTYARFNDEKYYESATWNLILANLGIGNKEEAKVLIADLLKIEGGYYSDRAEKLLKELEEK